MQSKLMGRTFAMALLVAGVSGLHAAAPASNTAEVARALADPGRAAQRGDDARRHPAELVGMSGVHAGQRVLDLIPGGGYWTKQADGPDLRDGVAGGGSKRPPRRRARLQYG